MGEAQGQQVIHRFVRCGSCGDTDELFMVEDEKGGRLAAAGALAPFPQSAQDGSARRFNAWLPSAPPDGVRVGGGGWL